MFYLTWSFDGSYLTLEKDYDTYSVPVDEYDGSFTLTLYSYELPDDPIFAGGLDMTFYPEY